MGDVLLWASGSTKSILTVSISKTINDQFET